MASFVPCNQSHLVEKDKVVFVKQQTDVWTTLSFFPWKFPSSAKIKLMRSKKMLQYTIWSIYSLPSPPLSHPQQPPLNQDQAVQA